MRIARALLILIAGALILAPPHTESCGPFLPEAEFHYILGPPDTAAYDAGSLGIVSPKYYRRNLIVAYRYFSGVPLTKEEAGAIRPSSENATPQQSSPAQQPFSYDTPDSAQTWLMARNAVAGVQPILKLPVYRQVTGSQFEQYLNCLDDAFVTAAATLKERLAKWHAGSAEINQWILGQDQVFQNCSEGVHIPSPVAAGSDPLLAADRRYQIAAAEFYAEKFDDAARDFQALGNAYLVARTLIRKATLAGDPTAMPAVEKQLQAILNDPARKAWHASARGLLNYAKARLDPEGRMVELGGELAKPGPGAKFAQNLTDYTKLWDKLGHGPAAQSELANWITEFQNPAGKKAAGRWRETRNSAWLLAALQQVPAKDAASADLIAAARQLTPQDPAYVTATYLAVQLQAASAQGDAARQWIDRVLAAKLPDAAHNAFLSERLMLARDWDEFLRYAPRQPVAVGLDMVDEELDPKTTGSLLLDDDSAWPLNHYVPLARWVDAARNPLLPQNLQVHVAQAGWVRAVVLDRTADGRALAARLADLQPELAQGLHPYLTETDAAATKFAAIFLMLRDPGFDVQVRGGFPRETKINAIDDYRDNWWNLAERAETDKPHPPKGFLAPEEIAAGEKEAGELFAAAPVAPNYLSAQAIDWARQHPEDPRVPEALHLVVRSTRFGITDKQSTAFSKAAFQLLHAKYPNSKWAQATKYWY